MIPFTFSKPHAFLGGTYFSICLRGKQRGLLFRNHILPQFNDRWYLNIFASADHYAPRIARVPLGKGDCEYARQAASRILPFFLVKQRP